MVHGDGEKREADPQIERTRAVVLMAARDLLFSEGPDALTHQRVAAAAHVGRATVYRHWPDRNDLLIDVLNMPALTPHVGDRTGPAHQQLQREMQLIRAALWGELGAVFAALIGRAEWDSRIAAAREKVVQWISNGPLETVKLGIQSGELAPLGSAELTVSQLIGVMVARRFVFNEPFSAEELDALIQAVVQPCGFD